MKTIIKIGIKCVLLGIIVLLIHSQLTLVFRTEKFNQGNNFRGFGKDVFDVIVLGSSHAQYSFNPSVYYQKTGNYAYVLGSACQIVPLSYEFLEESLKTQNPEVVVMDVFTMLPASSVCKSDGVIKTASEQLTGINRIRSLRYVLNKKENFLDYFFDMRLYHSRWPQMEKEEFSFPKDEVVDYAMGYIVDRPIDYSHWSIEPSKQMNERELDPRDTAYLLKIKEICEREGIELLLYKAPFMIDQDNYDALQQVWQFAEENKIDYVDCIADMDKMGFHMGIDSDVWHNNVWGARRVTEYLSDYITEYYSIEQHQYNELAEKQLNTLNKTSILNYFQDEADPKMILEIASKYDSTVLLQYRGNNETVIDEKMNELLNSIGFDFDFMNEKEKNYYAIIQNQKLIQSSNSQINYKDQNHSIIIDQNKMIIDDQAFESNGQMNLVVMINDYSWKDSIAIDYSKSFWRKGFEGYYPQGEVK